LYRQNIPVDIIFPDSDLSQYDIVIAPMLYMVKAGFAEKVEAFVQKGGSFVSTYFTGIVDETDLAFENGYPGPLSNVLGIWVEEIDALYEDQTNQIVMKDGGETYSCGHLADLLHAEGADVLAEYGTDFYAGMPVLTRNAFGDGAAYYIASDPEARFLDDFYGDLLSQHGIHSDWDLPEGVEISLRYKGEQAITFVLNHNAQPATIDLGSETYKDLLNDGDVSGEITLPAYDVRILLTTASQ
jgi:beta-galactosidase